MLVVGNTTNKINNRCYMIMHKLLNDEVYLLKL